MLLERLKSETSAQHRGLEAIMGMPESREDYKQRLERFLGFVEPWENSLTAALREHPELLEGRLKTGWLQSDLEFLGATPEEISVVPRCSELPRLTSIPAGLGSLYVMEGSTLGGQFIVRSLQKNLAITSSHAQYFSSYGSEVGRRWQEFRQHLLSFSSPENDDAIVFSARETFSCLERWFSQVRAND